jgi:hypothetical protein
MPKDLVEKEDWPTDLLAPVRFVNDSGVVVKTVTPAFEPKDLVHLAPPPGLTTLYDALHKPAPDRSAKRATPAKTWTKLYGCDE